MRKFLFILITIFSFNIYAAFTHHVPIILVHGALLTSAIWAPVQSDLQNQGYNVVTVDTPGRVKDGVIPQLATLNAAVNKICKIVEMQNMPVMLVGHSQAGGIITQAIQQCGNRIKGLVYVTAVVPQSGEKVFALLSEEDYRNFDIAAPTDIQAGLSIPNPKAPIKELFIGDASETDANHAINNMVPEPIILGDATLDYDAKSFNRIPKFYIKTLADKIISPETQEKYIKRQYWQKIFMINSGHSPFVTNPHELAKDLALINDQLNK